MLPQVSSARVSHAGGELDSKDLGAAQMALRAAVVYAAMVVVVRLGKKRFMGQATAFDVILDIMLGSVASRAITGNAPLGPALAAAAPCSPCTGRSRPSRSAGTASAWRSRA